jgi:hypothetical protein
MSFFKYRAGLDLGEVRDHSAFCLIEARVHDNLEELSDRGGYRVSHHITVLRRFPLEMKPEDVEDALAEFFARDVFRYPKTVLAVETNSIGLRVYRSMAKKGIGVDVMAGVNVGSGREIERHKDIYSVPKRDLVQPLRRAIQAGQLHIAPGLRWAPTLVEELTHYEQRLTDAGHLTYGNSRQTPHDDLVMATAHALFAGRATRGRAVRLIR